MRGWGKLGYRSIGDSAPVALLKQLLDPIEELSFQQRFITDHPGAMQKTLSIAFETTVYSPRYKSTRLITKSFICIREEPNDKLWKRGFAIARSDSPLFFVRSFQWNQTTMRWSRVSKAYHFLKILANCVDSMLFHCFYDSWNFVSIFPNHSYRICSNFALIEAIMAGTYSLKRFLKKKTPSTEKRKDK